MLKNKILAVAVVCSLAAGSLALVVSADDHGGGKGDNDSQKHAAKVVGSTLEVHITNNGKVLVRGAKITAISGGTIFAVTSWGSPSVNWTINTNVGTEFIRRFGGGSGISEMSVGDFISFQGMLDQTAPSLIVNAQVVKDFSIQKMNATFNGTIQSVIATSSASSTMSFVLATKNRGNVTVNVSGSTSIMKSGSAIAFGDLQAGNVVQASGVWDNLTNILAASKIVVSVKKPKPNNHTFEGRFEGNIKVGVGSSTHQEESH